MPGFAGRQVRIFLKSTVNRKCRGEKRRRDLRHSRSAGDGTSSEFPVSAVKAVDIANIVNPFNKNLPCGVFAGKAGVDIANIVNPFNKNLPCAVFAGKAGVDFNGTWAYGFPTCCGA
jgi:hypothetical protein